MEWPKARELDYPGRVLASGRRKSRGGFLAG